MKTLCIRHFVFVTAIASLASLRATNAAGEHDQHPQQQQQHGTLVPAAQATTNSDEAKTWLAKAKAEYPMTKCVVSGDKLEGGDMGPPADYVYKVEGKPDRLVRFCCKDCVDDFNKEPEKYLKAIDEAAAKKKAESGKQSS